MKSQHTFLKLPNVELLCCEALNSNHAAKETAKKLSSDPDWWENSGTGTISENTFLGIMEKSCRSKYFKEIMIALVNYIGDESITPTIINKVVHCPKKDIREYMIIALSHKDLPIEQLKVLCDQNIAFECYFQLAQKYAMAEDASEKHLDQLMKQFRASPFSSMEAELLLEIQEVIGKRDKIVNEIVST